jgi:hypothetical protein
MCSRRPRPSRMLRQRLTGLPQMSRRARIVQGGAAAGRLAAYQCPFPYWTGGDVVGELGGFTPWPPVPAAVVPDEL